jgi:hypothetical protein
MPLICAQLPENTWDLAMWPSGLGGGAARGASGDLAGELGRGVAGEELGVERAPSGCSLTAETGPATGRGRGRRRRPLEV